MNELMFRSVHQFVQRNKSKPFLCQRTTLALYPASFFFFSLRKPILATDGSGDIHVHTHFADMGNFCYFLTILIEVPSI